MVSVVGTRNGSRNLLPFRQEHEPSAHLERKIPPEPEVVQGIGIVALVSIALFSVRFDYVNGYKKLVSLLVCLTIKW